MDNQSIQHTRWNCTYHIVFIPKYRRKVMYGEIKRDLVLVHSNGYVALYCKEIRYLIYMYFL